MSVPVDVDGLRNLLSIAKQRGTEDVWQGLAFQWAEKASARITEVETERDQLRARVAELETASSALLHLAPPAPSCQPYGYGKEKDEPPCYLFRIPTDVIDRLREVLDK